MNIEFAAPWGWIGLTLLLWLLFDLWSGEVYLHRKVTLSEEPGLYWLTILIWSAVAGSCFIAF